ncbi:MAG: hypothetical protein EBR30_12005 [Cytophagia bacterium]|nr:hypothetical protein [Cytophagia bacterium]
MSDIDYSEESAEEENLNEPDAIRNLRAANKRNEERAKAGEAAMRKLAFLEAGLDPRQNPQVELFMKAYDGELSEEAIRSEAARYALISDAPADSSPEPDPSPTLDPEQTRVRGALGADSLDAAAPIREGDPMLNAYSEFHQLRREGATSEEASVAVLGKIFEQARSGNSKFVFDQSEWQNSESARSR